MTKCLANFRVSLSVGEREDRHWRQLPWPQWVGHGCSQNVGKDIPGLWRGVHMDEGVMTVDWYRAKGSL